MNISMVTTARGLVPATKPVGRELLQNLFSYLEKWMQNNYLTEGSNLNLIKMVTTQKNKMKNPRYPSLYQINTRVWITDIATRIGRPATLDDIPDNELDRLAEMGFDWIWFLSVWCTGEVAQKISRDNPEWRHDFEDTLPDLQEKDIAGSGF